MNKGRRHELKMLKYRQRMRKFRKPFLRADGQWNTFAYRSHSCPCSCYACQQLEDSYKRAEVKKELRRLLTDEIHTYHGEEQDKQWEIYNYSMYDVDEALANIRF